MSPPLTGPPLHRHGREDEWFYVLEGQFIFEVDGKQTTVGPGSAIFLPRGSAHTFQNISSSEGRLMAMVQPAGLEVFFTELAGAIENMDKGRPDMSTIVPIFERYGLEFLGPPIAARPPVASTIGT